jgi:phosphoglycolate phosphatase-like HAD superfamily hydrolase
MDLVIFDIDGTLIHSHKDEVHCFESALKTIMGITNISRDLNSYEHITDRGIVNEIIFRACQRSATDEEQSAIENEFISLFEKHLALNPPTPIPGVRGLFNELSEERDIALAIATGCYFRSASLKFTHANLPFHHLPISTSNDSAIRTDILQNAYFKAKRSYDVKDFDTITYIGDGPWDLQAVRKLDWNFIGISSNFSEAHLRELGAERIIKDYSCSDTFFSHLK